MAIYNIDQTNIDDFVNYEAEYKKVIKDAKVTGDNLVGKCPFHDDKRDSFSANIKTGQCHCFAGCIDGNYISFYSKLHNIDSKDAYKEILDEYGKLDEKENKQAEKSIASYTLKEYALQKRLPEEFLKNDCRVSEGRDRDGTRYVKMPYYAENSKDGDKPIFRKRYADKEFRWSAGSSGKLILYGEWRLPEFRKNNSVVLVEGESDTQTLWLLGINALGCPGASVFNEKMVPKLQDMKIYIHVEPDKAGETFLSKICKTLKDAQFTGTAYRWTCHQFGVKDPSELYIKEGEDEARAKLQDALRSADPIDLNKLEEVIPEAIKGAPVNLRQPNGWIYTEQGISKIDPKTSLPTLVCRTPIILTQRLKSMDTGEEKVQIAYKRDGEWNTAIYPRSTIFTARGITALADLGCTVTSENAKQVVSFLAALEAENIDIITLTESTDSFGWQSGNRFLPGYGDGIVLDIDPSLKSWAGAYCQVGEFSKWIELMRPHRDRDKFRFILASSFAAPLLRIVSQRIFFVYNWGGSKGGKTAALKAALSAWGDPDRLMVNFNATQVALERMAGFFCDLPLGIDERQLAGQKQGSLEQIIYMIASGTGRARGSKGGGLQEMHTWRTVAIATGEEPLSTDTTQTGVSTRVLELYGAPFDDEKSASIMHQQTPLNCGWAGPAFIGRIMGAKERDIIDAYSDMSEEVYALSGGINGSHVSGISAVALADAMVDSWFFAEQKSEEAEQIDQEWNKDLKIRSASWKRAVEMAKAIIDEMLTIGPRDVNENATQFIVDWIMSNKNQFGERVNGTSYGKISADGKYAYIFPSILNDALKKEGYSPRKTMKYLAENDIIETTTESNGKKLYSVPKWFDDKTTRMVKFDLGKFCRPSGSGNGSGSAEDAPQDPEDVWQSAKQEELPF